MNIINTCNYSLPDGESGWGELVTVLTEDAHGGQAVYQGINCTPERAAFSGRKLTYREARMYFSIDEDNYRR